MLSSLDTNPDEIKNERYAKAFRILVPIIEKQNEEVEFLMEDNQKLRVKSTYSKVKKPNLRFLALKRMKIFFSEKKGKKGKS